MSYADDAVRSYQRFVFIGSVGEITTYTPTEPLTGDATAAATCDLRDMKDTVTLSITDGTKSGTAKTLDFSDNLSLPLPESYVPLAGGTMSGNLFVERSDGGPQITASYTGSNAHKIALHVSTAGNAGLYDVTHSKWILCTDKNDDTVLSGNANGLIYTTARPTSADPTTIGGGVLRHFLASSSMTTNKPPTGDGVIIHLPWDGTNGFDAQIAVKNTTGQLAVRGMSSKTWQSWIKILDETNYSSYALPLTGGTLSGNLTVEHSGDAYV